jgi:hypothetical protein
MKRSAHLELRSRLPVIGVVSCLLLTLAGADPAAAQQLTDVEKEEFLRRAEILRTEHLSTGITESLRVTLSDGQLTHDAHLQTVDKFYKRFRTAKRTYYNYRDSYVFNIAAYRLDRLLDLNMVPVSIERRVHRDRAALTWWVDDVLMMDKDRYEQGIQPPDMASWNHQMHQARVFTQLIHNTDPNLGNFLITNDWQLRMIDFTRAFRPEKKLPESDLLVRIDRRVYDALKALTLEVLQREMRSYLRKTEMRALIARRDAIVDIFAARIADRGESAVVCDLPEH